jgi:hypothetical protein
MKKSFRAILIAAAVALLLFLLLNIVVFPREQLPVDPGFHTLSGPYLGQTPPGAVAERFAPQVFTQELHSAIVFSRDATEAYWRQMDEGPPEILYTRLEEGRWTYPQVVPFASRFFDSDDPCLSPNGSRLYFTSWRPTQWRELLNPRETIWYVTRTARGWSGPRPVSAAVNGMELHWQVSVSSRGTLCFASAEDIFCSRFDGREHGGPERLPPTINTPSKEGQPFISPDENYLIFSSNGHPDCVGDFDLYVSARDADGSWSQAVNLGRGVNSPHQELCPAVSPDGQYLFFLSSRDGTHSVYWVDATSIEPLQP